LARPTYRDGGASLYGALSGLVSFIAATVIGTVLVVVSW